LALLLSRTAAYVGVPGEASTVNLTYLASDSQ
jgi:hypothetical protein